MKTIKTEKQYGNHYEQISMHLRMLQAGASTGSLLYEPAAMPLVMEIGRAHV